MPNLPRMLYLIDGHAQLFRAYFAIRGGMSSPTTGEPTNASFAFAGMLIKFFETLNPRYAVMAIDTAGKTFRDELYEQYKATRESPPDDFAVQVPRMMDMTKMFGIPIIGQPGAEADDIIATIVQRVLDDPALSDVHVRMVSKDKDLEQLFCDRVEMFDIHTDKTLNETWLKGERGITPRQVVDLLALTGDKVDNIPGVEGVGPKTAAKLLEQYGSIDGIYDHIDQIKGKRKENLLKARELMPLSRELVTLKRDVDLKFELEDAKLDGIDAAGLRTLFRELGFRRHADDVDRIAAQVGDAGAAGRASESTGGSEALTFAESLFGDDGGGSGKAAAGVPGPGGFGLGGPGLGGPGLEEGATDLETAADCDYALVTTKEQLDELVATLSKLGPTDVLSVDTETVGLGHRAALCGVCLAWEPRKGVYVPVRSPKPDDHLDEATVIEALRPVLGDASIPKTGHNLKYDLLVLRHAGDPTKGVEGIAMHGVAFDSMIASHLIGGSGHGLDHLAEVMVGHRMIPISRLIGERPRKAGKQQKTMDQVPLDALAPYAAEDADVALRLREAMLPRLQELGMMTLADEVEMPLVEVLAQMEFHGIRVDPDELEKQKQALAGRIVELRDLIHEVAGGPFNIDSPKQLAEVLFKKLGLPVIKKTKTGPSTDIEVLEKLADMDELPPEQAKAPHLIVEYRQLTKLTSTYLEALRESIDDETGRIHATFHQTGAATGRLSSSGPNLQNIPIRTDIGRLIRKAFVAEAGCMLISADYSQIELRILAHLSDDPALIEAFRQDMDIHTAVACQVFQVEPDAVTPQMRTHAKTINFGIVYGVTPYGLARRIEGLDVPGATKLIDDYKKRFAGIGTFLAECVAHAEKHGYVATMLGRRRAIPQINSRNPNTRSLGERLAINTVVQGSAADLIKQAMVNLHRRIERENLPMKMLLQIHDELVLESPEGEAEAMAEIVEREMEGAMELKVPLKVEAGVGKDWMEAK